MEEDNKSRVSLHGDIKIPSVKTNSVGLREGGREGGREEGREGGREEREGGRGWMVNFDNENRRLSCCKTNTP